MMTMAPTVMSRMLKILLASRFCCSLPFCFSEVSTGTKAAESAVSAKRSRRRLGIRNAATKASVDRPAPYR